MSSHIVEIFSKNYRKFGGRGIGGKTIPSSVEVLGMFRRFESVPSSLSAPIPLKSLYLLEKNNCPFRAFFVEKFLWLCYNDSTSWYFIGRAIYGILFKTGTQEKRHLSADV